MGSIDGPSDVSYRLFVRDFIEDIEFSRPFAVTLTMNSVQWRSHSQNFRHFMNRLNQSFLKSGYRRYGKRPKFLLERILANDPNNKRVEGFVEMNLLNFDNDIDLSMGVN